MNEETQNRQPTDVEVILANASNDYQYNLFGITSFGIKPSLLFLHIWLVVSTVLYPFLCWYLNVNAGQEDAGWVMRSVGDVDAGFWKCVLYYLPYMFCSMFATGIFLSTILPIILLVLSPFIMVLLDFVRDIISLFRNPIDKS